MSQHLERQFETLKKMILALGAQVEEAVQRAIRAVEQRDESLAKQVIADDERIDSTEIDVEEECLHTLALYQPVANDMRFIVALLKMNNDLERIGDLAVNIAEQAIFISSEAPVDQAPFHIPDMAQLVEQMLRESLDSLVHRNTQLAEQVRRNDDQIDQMHRQMYDTMEQRIAAQRGRIKTLTHFLSVSRQLERIADHAVNIAEDVVYMVNGQILRHSRPQADPPQNQ